MEPSEKLLAQVTDRVQTRMPAAAREEVEALVAGLFLEFAASRVRDYVPIFVEREAIDELRRRENRPGLQRPRIVTVDDPALPARILEPH